MRKKALKKDFRTEIKKSRNRFLSIFAIVALGVAFYSGIQSAAPDMRVTEDAYFDDSNLMDLRVISTLGLTEDDLDAIAAIEGVEKVEGSWMEDVYCGEGEAQVALHVEAIPETMNGLAAAQGSLPSKAGECFLDEAFAESAGYEPGDTIEIEVSDEDSTTLTRRTFTVSGCGYSPCYIAFDRGSTTLGTGSLSGFVYVTAEDFDSEVYSVVYIQAEGAKDEMAYTDAYDTLIEEVQERIEDIADARCEIRYNEVVGEAESELADARQEVEDGKQELADAKQELEDGKAEAESELAEAESELLEGESELESGKQELEDAIAEADEGESELLEGESELAENEASIASAQSQIDSALATLNKSEAEYQSGLSEYQSQEKSAKKELSDAQQQIDEGKAQLESGKQEYEESLAQIESGEAQIQEAEVQLESGETAYEQAESEYAANKSEYDSSAETLAQARTQLESGKTELAQQQSEYESGLAAYETAESEYTAQSESLAAQKQTLEESGAQVTALQEGLASAQAQAESLQTQLTQAQASQEALPAQITEAQTQAESLQSQLTEAQAQADSLSAQAQTADSLVSELQTQIDTAAAGGTDVAGLQAQIDAAEANGTDVAGLQAQIDAAAANGTDVAGLQAQIDAAAANGTDVAGLQAQIDAAEERGEDVSELREQLAAAEANAALVADLQAHLAAAEANVALIADLQAQLAATEANVALIADLRAQLETAQANAATVAELQTQLAAAQESAASLHSSLDAANAQVSSLQQSLTDAQTQQATLEAQLSALAESIPALEAGLAEAQSTAASLQTQYDEASAAISAGEAQIAEAETQLAAGRTQLDETKAQLDSAAEQLSAAQTQLIEKEQELTAGETQLAEAKAQLDEGRSQLDATKAQLDATKAQLEEKKNELASGKQELASAKQQLEASESELTAAQAEVDSGYQELSDAKAQLTSARSQLDEGWAEYYSSLGEFNSGKQQLEEGRQELSDAREELADAREQIAEAQKEIEENEQKIADGWEDYEEGRKEAEQEIADGEQKIADAEQELADAEQKIADAEEELADISYPEWYVSDRSVLPDNTGYGENADRMTNIAEVFPVLFFLVAALISLTTMTRMVEEERTQIGTLKALGYGRADIASKYLKYAFFATVGGSIVGILIGEKILPWIIINAYEIMYHYQPQILVPYNWKFGFIASAVSLLCTMGATLVSCLGELRTVPAQLMRPPAPKQGKRVWLEYIPFIWKPLSFSWKSTVRNLMRYKKRFLMTVIGIGGCMGLLLVGYGLRDSITDVGVLQYQQLQLYDAMLVLDTDASEAEQNEVVEAAASDSRVTFSKRFYMQKLEVGQDDAAGTGKTWTVYLYVPENLDDIGEYFTFRSRTTGETYELGDDGAIITEKIATEFDISVGDTISVKNDDDQIVQIPVAAICENYLSHYVYLTPALYEQLFGEAPEYNSIFFCTDEEESVVEQIGSALLSMDAGLTITYTESLLEQIENMLGALDLVIIVLIVSAGMLAFVVLYNLNNININERKRELATLKVLGFYDGEVDAYVYRENILLTVIGTGVGCLMGKFLHAFTISTVEVDSCMFGRSIYLPSYVYGTLFTFGFSVVVNFVMHFKLKKIDMVESLKSIE